MKFYEKVSKIQTTLKSPKSQFNAFSNFNYRSCEDILSAVKPLLEAEGLVLLIGDAIVLIGDRYYVEATARITDGEANATVKAYARECLAKKGMDESQITGAASSYARKYALNGLFLIDDTKDADHSSEPAPNAVKQPGTIAPPKAQDAPQAKNPAPAKKTTSPAPNARNKALTAGFTAMKKKMGDTDYKFFLGKYGVKEIKEIKTFEKAEQILRAMKDTVDVQEGLNG